MIKGLWPDSFFHFDLLNLVADWICYLQVKKDEQERLLREWADDAHVELTGEDVDRATGVGKWWGCATKRGSYPASWLREALLPQICDFIRQLNLPIPDKKQMILEWVDSTGVELTAEIVTEATGRPAGEV